MWRSAGRFAGVFSVTLLLFLALNLLVAALRSDCGWRAVVGISGCADDIVRAGFPLVFLEQGGFIGQSVLNIGALVLDALIGLALAVVAGVFWLRRGER